MKAILIAAAGSGAGKTSVSLGLMRALRKAGEAVRSVKLGPDYIDPAFHAAATGQTALNLDAWAMSLAEQRAVLVGDGPLVIESAVGLYDGAGMAGAGSAADVAAAFDLPILLVVDCARAAQSVPALVEGLVQHRAGLRFHGLLLNNVGSERHEALLRAAFSRSEAPQVLGVLPRRKEIALPSRHLGLVQAQETARLGEVLDHLATWVMEAASPMELLGSAPDVTGATQPPLFPVNTLAIAQDAAFSFVYPHLLARWNASGTVIRSFSPLADEPVPEADAVFLPGGYPELHAGRLAANAVFMQSLRKRSQSADIIGECGGYMTLGNALIDADGRSYEMAGLLDVTTSFAQPKLTLGYRQVTADDGILGGRWAAHEFHYSTAIEERGTPLFTSKDPDGQSLPPMGLRMGRVMGSYAHIIAGHHDC